MAAVSRWAPDEWANTAVGAIFLFVTWATVLRGDTPFVRGFGLSLGGIGEPEPLEARRLLVEGARAVGWALLLAAIFFPPFWYGYAIYWKVDADFRWVLGGDFANRAMGQLMVVALPEEAFFRGYLQSALERGWGRWRKRVLGVELGLGWLVTSAIFAFGHLLTVPHASRLAVFFPALVFGWARARTGGIGAALLFHAMCNLLSEFLARGYGLIP